MRVAALSSRLSCGRKSLLLEEGTLWASIAGEGRSVQASEDRPTVLLGANVAADFDLSDAGAHLPPRNPRALRSYAQCTLPVLCSRLAKPGDSTSAQHGVPSV